MLKLEIFDPPMCCSTGICGSNADQVLVIFASDLEWLKSHGVTVVRYGLALEPSEFSKNEAVRQLINREGNSCLPILVIGKEIVSKGRYPSRDKLAELCKIEYDSDEAPPIHREENCCCGVDCDCGSVPENACSKGSKNDCASAAAELNCYTEDESEFQEFKTIDNLKRIGIVIWLIIIIVVIAAVSYFVK